MVRGTRDPQAQRFMCNLIVPGSFTIGMKKNVRMRFDKTWQQSQSGKIDNCCVCRNVDRTRRSGRFDLLTANKHNPTVVQLCRLAIENASGFEQVNGFRLSARCSVLKKKWGLHEQAKNNKEGATHRDAFLNVRYALACRGAELGPDDSKGLQFYVTTN